MSLNEIEARCRELNCAETINYESYFENKQAIREIREALDNIHHADDQETCARILALLTTFNEHVNGIYRNNIDEYKRAYANHPLAGNMYAMVGNGWEVNATLDTYDQIIQNVNASMEKISQLMNPVQRDDSISGDDDLGIMACRF